MARHYLKTQPPFFDELVAQRKTFEIRYDDRDFQAGDVVVLQEFIPDPDHADGGKYTGRDLTYTIGYVTNFAQRKGYVVFSILPVERINQRVQGSGILEQVMEEIQQHHRNNPGHGFNCSCMDRHAGALRKATAHLNQKAKQSLHCILGYLMR